jgi:hypothetical protein
MSERTIIGINDQASDEIERTLADVANLETDLRAELCRLSDVRAPRVATSSPRAFRGRALWWWRVMVTTWAWSPQVEESHPGDVLRGFRYALRGFSDAELEVLLREGASNGRNSSAA